jgi:S1-C subfamily serine protease
VSTGDLVSALDEHSIGDIVSIRIRRDAGGGNPGKELELTLTLQEEVT